MKKSILIGLTLLLPAIAGGGGEVRFDRGSGGGDVQFDRGAGGGNVQFDLGLSEPINLTFTAVSSNTLSVSWSIRDLTPPASNYHMEISSGANFSAPLSSSDTVGTAVSFSGLAVNRWYYGRVRGTHDTFNPSPWSGIRSTATLAVTPVTVASTWTMVGLSSITFAWAAGDNPVTITQYVAHLSTVSGFGSGTTLSSTTYNLNATFTGLAQATTYYGRVKAVNLNNVSTAFLTVGSTVTQELSTFFEDTFTDANGTLLTDHTSDSGHTWTMGTLAQFPGYDGTIEIQSNKADPGAGNPIGYTNATPASADYSVTMTLTGTSYTCGPALRVDASAGDAYFVYWEDGGALRWTLNKFDGSTETVLDNTYTGDDPAGGKVVKLEAIGSSIKVYLDGVERISVTDSAVSAAGTPGIVMSDASAQCDDMSALNE